MQRLNNSFLIYADLNYNHAVNYQRMYNAPITLNYGLKHNRKKYIIGAGTCDHIELWQEGVYVYVLAENIGLQYIGLQTINIETDKIENNIFLDGEDYTPTSDLTSQEQINFLLQYA